jgi:hypothetical protein
MTSITGAFQDEVAVATQTTMVTRINSWITGMSASGVLGGQLLVMYKNRSNPATAQLYPVASFTVQQVLATQRRRIRKAAHH